MGIPLHRKLFLSAIDVLLGFNPEQNRTDNCLEIQLFLSALGGLVLQEYQVKSYFFYRLWMLLNRSCGLEAGIVDDVFGLCSAILENLN